MPSGVKISNLEFRNKFNIIQPKLKLIDSYINMKNSIKVMDGLGIVYILRPQDLLLGKTPTIQSAEDKNQAFMIRSKSIHGDKYLYNNVRYTNAKSKVFITCKIHGDWLAIPDPHLTRNQGCPKCGKISSEKSRQGIGTGWNLTSWRNQGSKAKKFSGFKLYIILCENETESFIKVGRTYLDIKKRFEDKNKMPYSYSVLYTITSNAKSIYNLERIMKSYLKVKYIPNIKFGGLYECFKNTKENLLLINELPL